MTNGKALLNQRIPTRDGIELAADVVLPAGEGPFPVVVNRTPYIRQEKFKQRYIEFVGRGYAMAAVDVRGRGDSDGQFVPFQHDTADGYDVVEWLAAQSWSNGKVGMVGNSYEGLTQWWTAKAHPPSLRCIVPTGIGMYQTSEIWSRGSGIPLQYSAWWFNLVTGRTGQQMSAPSWDAGWGHLPLATLDEALGTTSSAWKLYVNGEIDWMGSSWVLTQEDWDSIDVPAMVRAGWWEAPEAIATWLGTDQTPARERSRLVLGAWDHIGNWQPRAVLGGLDVSASVVDPIDEVDRFLACYLKDDGPETDGFARCRVFRTGAMRWDELDNWPVKTTQQSWYLGSAGDARTLNGDGVLSQEPTPGSGSPGDSLVHEPSERGRDMMNMELMVFSDPPLDQRYVQRRRDTLVYTSAPLETPLAVSGEAEVELHVSIDTADADVIVDLCDVDPKGQAIGIGGRSSGRRLRYRDGPEPQPVTPGDVMSVRMTIGWMHHEFQPGHRMRVTVRCSGYPFLSRNLGTGEDWTTETEAHLTTLTLHHTAEYPSRLLLPVEEAAS